MLSIKYFPLISRCTYLKHRYFYNQNVFGFGPWSYSSSIGRESKCFHVNACQYSDLPQPTLNEYRKEVTPSSLKIKRTPFLKNLFKGLFDKDVLAFPEVMNYEELDSIQNMVLLVKNFMNQNVDFRTIDEEGKISLEIIEGLKSLGLFSSMSPSDLGGLGLKQTEHMWLMEAIGNESSLGLTVNSHHSLISQLLICLNDDQKNKFRNIFSGHSVVAFCIAEEHCGSDLGGIKTRATLCEIDNQYLISGKKTWVTNADIADVFVVAALGKSVDAFGEEENTISAFLINKDAKGVKIEAPMEKTGIRGLSTCTVEFNDVTVHQENLIKDEKHGLQLILNVFNQSRLSQSACMLSMMKDVINIAIQHCIKREQFNKPLKDFEIIQEKISLLVSKTYAAESMIYMTAGLQDSTESPDLILESSATKVYTSEALLYCVQECMQIVAANSVIKGNPIEKVSRDSKVFPIMDQTNEFLRLYIALTGCVATGQQVYEIVDKLRNPLFNPKVSILKTIEQEKIRKGIFKKNLDLPGYLHETLFLSAEQLEVAVKKFAFAVEVFLVRYGPKVIEKQMELRKIADMAIEIYAMTCILSRASRSYSIGLPNAKLEIDIANTFSQVIFEKVEELVKQIDAGPFVTIDTTQQSIAKQIFKNKEYSLVNPSLRNY